MAISSTTSSSDTTSTAAILASLKLSGNNATKDTNSAAAQQSQFLTLLTTQLKNQDPLNPMDNSQMTSQIAQISTVDGINKLNTTLQSLIDNSNSAQVTQAAALVGHNVLVPGSGIALGPNGGGAGFELPSAVDKATVTISDANGIVVKTLNMGSQKAGVQSFMWDGKTDSGAPAAQGNYSFAVTATQGTNAVTATKLQLAPVNGVIRSVTGSTTSALLDVGTLGNFAMSDIRQIY